MAKLNLIKEIAKAKDLTLEQVAERAGLKAQAIHLMVRKGSTSIDTLEKIAAVLEVPAYIFLDYEVDINEFKREVILGGQNAYSYFGQQTNHFGTDEKAIAAKDDLIAVLNSQIKTLEKSLKLAEDTIEELREDKRLLRAQLSERAF